MNKKFFLSILLGFSILSVRANYFIGAYAAPYNVLNPIIQESLHIDRQEFEKLLPGDLFAALTRQGLVDKNLSLSISILGKPLFGDVADRTFNLVFHNQVREWLPGKPKDFNVNTLIGIFDPKGITDRNVSQPASFNALRQENVHVHDGGEFYSPNNIRFKLEDGKALGSFWSVVVSPDKKNVLISLNIIIDNQEFEGALAGILGQAPIVNAAGIVALMKDIKGALAAHVRSDVDQIAFLSPLTTFDQLS
jgi:hypothetical protein